MKMLCLRLKKFKVELTKKAEPFVEEVMQGNTEKLIAFEYQIGKVEELSISIENNSARLKVELNPVNISPFAILMTTTPKTVFKHFNLSNTSGRWQYCD